jgi:hypothetical protein
VLGDRKIFAKKHSEGMCQTDMSMIYTYLISGMHMKLIMVCSHYLFVGLKIYVHTFTISEIAENGGKYNFSLSLNILQI